MSARHPIIAVTGSSGAGTTSVSGRSSRSSAASTCTAAFVEGDSFHRYDRAEMKERMARRDRARRPPFQPFRSRREPVRRARGAVQRLRRDRTRPDPQVPARRAGGGPLSARSPGTFTAWEDLPPDTDLLFYEGLHGAVVTDEVDVARHVDLLIGVTPVINLEWIQKLHRDKATRGYSAEAVTDVILRRMHDYVNYICPQFSRTHINFQRVPVVDTSNPFVARFIPAPDESFLVIRFANPRGIDFPYLLSMLHDSFMSRANTIVCPGGKMDLAMQLIFTPMIWRLLECKKESQARALVGARL